MKQFANGLKTNKTVILGVDWSRKVIDVYNGETWDVVSSLPELAAKYPHSIVILEATAESFELWKRLKALEAFKENDVEVYCFPTHWTAKYRKMHNIAKTGPADAKSIYEIATTWPRTLCRFKERRTDDKLGKEIAAFLIFDRNACDGEETMKLAEQYLQNYPAEFKEFIEAGSKSKPTKATAKPRKSNKPKKQQFRKQPARFLHVAVELRKAGEGYEEFRRQIGNYAQGYGRMTRSEYYHWWVMPITNARIKQAGQKIRKKKEEQESWFNRLTDQQKQIHRQVMKDANKVLKYIWKCTASVQKVTKTVA